MSIFLIEIRTITLPQLSHRDKLSTNIIFYRPSSDDEDDDTEASPLLPTKNSKGKSVVVQLPTPDCESDEVTGPWDLDERVCLLAHKLMHISRLQLYAKKRALQFKPPQVDNCGLHMQSFSFLEDMITKGIPISTREAKTRYRYTLALVLASGLLQVSDSPWSPMIWSKQQVYFRNRATMTGFGIGS
jgi:hypothetical protein